MSNNLTLGPLHFDGDLVCFRHPNGDEDSIASLFCPDAHDDEEKNEAILAAYGNLFAAASELLEALESILTAMPDLENMENPDGESMLPLVVAARAARDKAKGEP